MSLADEIKVVDGIVGAIADQSLKAGTKLGELPLSEIYGCSRADVRRALITLSSQRVVDLKKNRGAFVTRPSPREAREVFQARRAIERTLARNAALNASAEQIAALYEHSDSERIARGSGDRADAIRLSGQFHLILGEAGDNTVLLGYLSELIVRSSLIIGLYSSERAPTCRYDDHRQIVAAIEKRDIEVALTLLDAHLRHIEASVRFESDDAPVDLHQILARGRGDSRPTS